MGEQAGKLTRYGWPRERPFGRHGRTDPAGGWVPSGARSEPAPGPRRNAGTAPPALPSCWGTAGVGPRLAHTLGAEFRAEGVSRGPAWGGAGCPVVLGPEEARAPPGRTKGRFFAAAAADRPARARPGPANPRLPPAASAGRKRPHMSMTEAALMKHGGKTHLRRRQGERAPRRTLPPPPPPSRRGRAPRPQRGGIRAPSAGRGREIRGGARRSPPRSVAVCREMSPSRTPRALLGSVALPPSLSVLAWLPGQAGGERRGCVPARAGPAAFSRAMRRGAGPRGSSAPGSAAIVIRNGRLPSFSTDVILQDVSFRSPLLRVVLFLGGLGVGWVFFLHDSPFFSPTHPHPHPLSRSNQNTFESWNASRRLKRA